jgi:glucokinase
MEYKCFIGLDIGGTKISTALFDISGNVLAEDKVLLAGARGKEVLALIVKELRALILFAKTTCCSETPPVGICVPGIAYHESGKVWAPNIPGWDDYPLLEELKEALGKEIKIYIDSDRACSILGETWRGSAKGSKNAVFVAVGTGIGAGILMDGRILRGHGDIAGATGWMALQPPYDKKYDACGCFEYYASGEGIARTAREYLLQASDYKGIINNASSAKDIFAAYEDKDPIAIKTFDHVIAFWGMATANYVSLFDPEKIIFGGGVFGPAVQFIPRIREEAEKWAQPIAMKQVTLIPSVLGDHAGLIGAGRLAMINQEKG